VGTLFAQQLEASLAVGPVAIFAGAGISSIPPTNLPSWSSFNAELINQLYRHATTLGDVWTPLIEELSHRIDTGQLPTEYLSQIIANRIGARYFPVLSSLDGDRPNAVHGWLSSLAAAHRLRVIVTTNFDTLIERALERDRVPHRVISQPEHFEGVEERIGVDQETCYVLKIHGSVTDTGGRLVDTLAQRLVGLPESIGRTIVRVLDCFPIFFMGTSGSDLRAGDDYLHLRRGHIAGRSLFWMTPSGSPVQGVVASLMDYYREHGASTEVLHATLPDDLPGAPPLTQPTSQRVGDSRFVTVLEQWGADLGALECAQLLTDFSDHVGLPHIGMDALQRVLPSDPYMPAGAAAPLAIRLAEILTDNGDKASSVRAIALLNQAQRSGTLPADALTLRLARARVFGAGSRLDDATRELSHPPASTPTPDAQTHEAAILRALCLRRLGRWHDSLQAYEQAANDAVRGGYPFFEGECRLAVGELHGFFGEYADADRNLAQAKYAFERVGATGALAKVPMARARLAMQQRRYDAACAQAEDATRGAGWTTNLLAESRARILWAEGLNGAGDERAAASMAERAMELANASADRELINEIQNTKARILLDKTAGPQVHIAPQSPDDIGATTPSERYQFFMGKAEGVAHQRHFEQAYAWMAQAENEIERLDPGEVAERQIQLALTFGKRLNNGNNPHSAYERFTRARTLLSEHDPNDITCILQATANQADALRRAGRAEDAIARYEEGIATAGRLVQIDTLVPQMKFYEAAILLRFGRLGEAAAKLDSAAEDADQLARRTDVNRQYLGLMLNWLMTINDQLSVCRLEQNAHDEAQACVARVMELARTLGADDPRPVNNVKFVARIAVARHWTATGKQQEAESWLRSALEHFESPLSLERSDEKAARVLRLLAQNSLPRDRFKAQKMLRRAVEIWELLAEPIEAAQCMRELAGHLFRGGDVEPAQGALEQAERHFGNSHNQHGLGQCRLMRAQWALQNGTHAKAKALAAEALQLIPDRSHVHSAMATAIASDRWDSDRWRWPIGDQFPELIGELVGRARTVRFYRGTVEHAAGRYADPYDRILYFRPMDKWRLTGNAKSVVRLSHPDWDNVGILLDEIASQCAADGVNTVAAMPFGGVDNLPFLPWIDESGQPSELDVYFLDTNDYRDVIPAQSA
jgi:tetratricopeptide (TPR) repeat protein